MFEDMCTDSEQRFRALFLLNGRNPVQHNLVQRWVGNFIDVCRLVEKKTNKLKLKYQNIFGNEVKLK